MSYYRRQYRRPENVNSPELEARVRRMATELYTHLTDWEKGFSESILDSYEKWGGLSPKQLETFEKIEARYSEEALAKKEGWAESFDDEKREIMALVVKYYESTGYFGRLMEKIKSDPSFVPDERVWAKFVENKYAQKALKAQTSPTKFVPGGFASMRDTFYPSNPGVWLGSATNVRTMFGNVTERKGRPVLVLKLSERISTDKVWICSFIDNPAETFEIEERWIKKYRQPKKK